MLFSKCRAKLFCGLLLLALFLSACGPSSEVSAPVGEDVDYPLLAENQPGVGALLGGACPSSTADGYYCVIGEKIKFSDAADGAMVTVCAQPGCSHSDETCQAWIGTVSCFREYNGQIYANREDGGSIQFIRKDLTDGNITVLAEWKATDTVSYVPGNIMISEGGAIAYLHSQFSREEGEKFRMDSIYTVWHIDLTTGEKRELFSGGSGLTFVWALSKSHAVVLYCAAEQGLSLEEFNAEYGGVNAVNFELRLYDADFNHYTVLTVMDEGIASGCAYGKEAVYVEGDEVFLVNVDTGEIRRLLTLENIIAYKIFDGKVFLRTCDVPQDPDSPLTVWYADITDGELVRMENGGRTDYVEFGITREGQSFFIDGLNRYLSKEDFYAERYENARKIF